jgi:hypothetical protein
MRKMLLALCATAAFGTAASAQTIFNGVTSNPACVPSGSNGCATAFAPSGAALTARNSFFSNLTASAATQNFESQTVGTGAPLNLNFGFAGTATLTGNGSISNTATSIGVGRFATSGTNFWESSTSTTGTSFAINFSQAVAGFGFYAVDLGEFGGGLTMRFLQGATVVSTQVVLAPTGNSNFVPGLEGSIRFFGALFGTNAFNRVEFVLAGNATEDFFGFDDMTVADVTQVMPSIPEPSTYVLMITGLAGLAGIARRRRNV